MNADLETQIIELNNNPAFCALREKFAQDTIFDILGATNRRKWAVPLLLEMALPLSRD